MWSKRKWSCEPAAKQLPGRIGTQFFNVPVSRAQVTNKQARIPPSMQAAALLAGGKLHPWYALRLHFAPHPGHAPN